MLRVGVVGCRAAVAPAAMDYFRLLIGWGESGGTQSLLSDVGRQHWRSLGGKKYLVAASDIQFDRIACGITESATRKSMQSECGSGNDEFNPPKKRHDTAFFGCDLAKHNGEARA